MKRYFLDTPYGQIHYVVAGPDSGLPVVMLHQTPRSIDEYIDVIPILSKKCRVIAMDTLGYGDSDKPQIQPTIKDYAEIVKMLLDSLGIEKANLVGHHTGSRIAIEFAASYPERMDKLIVSGAVYRDEEERKRAQGSFQQWHVKPDGSHLTELWQRLSSFSKAEPSIINRQIIDMLKAGEKSEYGHWACVAHRMEDRLPFVKCPTLLIFGKRDPVFTEKSSIFKKVISQSREVLVEGGGIYFPEEMPETFAELVIDFLKP